MTDRPASDVCLITYKLSFLSSKQNLLIGVIKQIPLRFDYFLKFKTGEVKRSHSYSYCYQYCFFFFNACLFMVKCLFLEMILERSILQSVTVQ